MSKNIKTVSHSLLIYRELSFGIMRVNFITEDGLLMAKEREKRVVGVMITVLANLFTLEILGITNVKDTEL